MLWLHLYKVQKGANGSVGKEVREVVIMGGGSDCEEPRRASGILSLFYFLHPSSDYMMCSFKKFVKLFVHLPIYINKIKNTSNKKINKNKNMMKPNFSTLFI